MSHYSVMVCLPGETKSIAEALDQALAPFDENLEVEAYRDYEDGSPEEYWWVKSVKRGAQEHADDAPVEIRRSFLDGDKGVWSNRRNAHITEAEYIADEKADRAEDAKWAVRLGVDPISAGRITPSWRTVVQLYNEKWHPANLPAVPGTESRDDDGDALWYDPETDRAYTMSTRNPQSMWDYWRVGGRWSGYFVADEGDWAPDEILEPEHHWDGPKKSRYPNRTVCDGGRKRWLDFATMREAAGSEADERYGKWLALVEQYGPIKSWAHFRDQVNITLTIEEARRLYGEQPLVVAHNALPYEEQLVGFMGNSLDEEFGTTREEYVKRARDGAVPAYATVLLSGDWTAPGRMGWFGMSPDGPGEREGYNVAVNKYLEELKPDTWLVVVDCHI